MIRPIVFDEWNPLMQMALIEQFTSRLYTAAEIDAVLDPDQGGSSWLPKGEDTTLVDLGIEVDGQIVGMVFVHRRKDGVGVLESLFVHPDHRSAGHGTRLVRAAIEALRTEGLEDVEVFAMEREPEAIRWWSGRLGPPNAPPGVKRLAGNELIAQGWHLKTADVKI